MTYQREPKVSATGAGLIVAIVAVLLIISALLSPDLRNSDCITMTVDGQTGLWCPEK